MARKRLKNAGDTENKVRWNKKKTNKYEIVTKLIETKPKAKRKSTKSKVAKSTKTAKPKSTSKSSTKSKSKGKSKGKSKTMA